MSPFAPDRRLFGGAALIAMILVSAACGAGTQGPATASPGDSAPEVSAAAAVPTPRTTPPGTPAPAPAEVTQTSVEVSPPPPPPGATPTPGPEAGLWRLQGYVVDEDARPIESACVVVGPRGCQPYSPHTDGTGHWFLDVAEGTATFDFFFEMPGYQTVWWQVTPKASQEFNVVLKRG